MSRNIESLHTEIRHKVFELLDKTQFATCNALEKYGEAQKMKHEIDVYATVCLNFTLVLDGRDLGKYCLCPLFVVFEEL